MSPEAASTPFTCTTFLVPESVVKEFAVSASGSHLRVSTRVESDRILLSLAGGNREDQGAFYGDLLTAFGGLCVVAGETSAHEEFVEVLKSLKRRVVLAESCTGGLIAKYITDVPGSSAVFWGSFVTYDNEAKRRILHVKSVDRCGAVSRAVALEMAEGALAASGVDFSIAVSGVAGPGGGTPDKPVGTVHLAFVERNRAPVTRVLSLRGTREMIRTRTAVVALLLGRGFLDKTGSGSSGLDTDPIWNYI